MGRLGIFIVSVLLFSTSCGSKKIVEDQRVISKADYPYITKFHEGIRLKTTGRTSEAIAKFEECLALRQDDDAVFYALSQLELSSGNMLKSAEYILKASEIDPDNQWYIQELAYMHYELADYEKSAESFERLVKIEPRNVDWQYGYAEVLTKLGQTDKAIDALNKTEDQVGVNPALSIQKYNLLMEAKSAEKAIAELDAAKAVYPKDPQLIATYVDHYFNTNEMAKAVQMLEELVEADPSNGRAHLALADIYRQRGDDERSFQELKLAFESSDVDLDTKMKILINIHESSFKIDPEVYGLVDILVQSYPEEAKAHSIHADYLIRAEKKEEALVAYKKALEYDKNQYPIWNQVLIMEYQKSDFQALYEDSKECLGYFPTATTVSLLNGVSANQLKKFDEAIDVLSAGKELVLNDKPLEAEFYSQLGESYFGLNDISNAKKSYEKAMKIDNSSALIRNNYAFRLAMNKIELDLAESLALQAADAAPSHVQFLDTYGWVLFQKGEYARALDQFNRALNLNANDYMTVEHIGDVKFMQGKVDEAVVLWKEAKSLSSENKVLDKKIADKKYYDPVY
ncbi:MAG: tetratricopeptide repeat protein [Crocinitomicaceae bacterium]|nr:tetratricopeptide repeat protein [Crocinitomicaceae bacterium]